MNKYQIFYFFVRRISKTAIQRVDDEWLVVGKYCQVGIYDDGGIDLFICNPEDMHNGLGSRRLNSIVSSLKPHLNSSFTVGNGEAWGKVTGKKIILQNLKLLGIRKKRTVNPSHMRAMRKKSPLIASNISGSNRLKR